MRAAPPLLRVRNLHKTYRLGRVSVPVLQGVDLDLARGEWLAVLGASGSGKSTLLHLAGGLDSPDRAIPGQAIEFTGQSLDAMSARALNRYRAASVGFVFQFYHLLPELSVLDNVLLGAMILHGRFGYAARRGALRARARELLGSFGLGARLRHRPSELSGGERQRAAIARALINQPALLLADEPTGNLDRKTGGVILDALAALRASTGQSMIIVTHDPEVSRRADRVIHLVDGRAGAGITD